MSACCQAALRGSPPCEPRLTRRSTRPARSTIGGVALVSVVALLVLAAPRPHAAEVAPRMLLLDAARIGAELVAVGERGTILRSPNGTTWQSVPRTVRATLTAVSFAPAAGESSGRVGWAVGHDAAILATTDGGRTWQQQYRGDNLQDSFLDVFALDPNHVIAVGAYALFLETTDAGRTWQRRKIIEDDFHFNRVTRGPSGTLYLAGEHGTLLRSTDEGSHWTAIPTDYAGSFYGILPLQRGTLLAYGLRGHVYRSTDDGASWRQIATPQPVLLAAAAVTANGSILLAGYAGTLLLSRDDGLTFNPLDSPTKAVAELVELPNGNVLALGETGATVIPAPR